MIKEAAVTVAAVLPRRSLVSCSLRGILSSSSYSLADKEVSEKVERERARSEWEKFLSFSTPILSILSILAAARSLGHTLCPRGNGKLETWRGPQLGFEIENNSAD